ncbi:MAG TPA: GntR family transcriptional regulator [Steroidobacteraceae bacterium]|jgi:DNA-binding FadR family transcriptional regulator|nr:GntR family transcriptional regulator [Steroidobacteraceae bacterium]
MSVAFDQILLVPGYRRVAAAIAKRILSRELHEGERLPPETELARQFGVNRSTVREALRELESGGLLERRPGSKRMTVSRPQHRAVAKDVSRALALHGVTFFEVWEALTQLEPPMAEIAARNRTQIDLDSLAAVSQRFAAESADTERAVHRAAEFFRCVGCATHNQVLGLAQEPLLDLLEPSLRVMIDMVPQARSRIAAAERRILEAIGKRDAEAARGWMARHIRDFRKGYELADIALDCRIA